MRPRKKSRHKNGITSCTEWLPSIDVDATVDGEVKVKYSPQNPWASQIEFALHNGNGHLQVNRTFQDKVGLLLLSWLLLLVFLFFFL